MKNTLSIASFIFGILSLSIISFFIPIPFFIMLGMFIMSYITIFALFGVIFGVIAIFQIRKTKAEGLWLAILGIIFSIIGVCTFFWILMAVSGVIGSFI